MASPVEVTIVLCDAAVADATTGKMHMLGANWSVTSTPTPAHAVAVLIKVPWDRANQKLPLVLELRNADGRVVELHTPAGGQQLAHHGVLEVGRPPGATHGTPLDASFALNVPPLPLAPGRYEWHVEIAQTPVGGFFEVRDAA